MAQLTLKSGKYIRLLDITDDRFYCTSHHREATHYHPFNQSVCCDPALGGIMLPCFCEPLKDQLKNDQ